MLGALSTAVSYAAPGWTLETFSSISGSQVKDLTSSTACYAPSSRSVLTSSAIPANTADNYGSRIRGYVVPRVSGLHTFWESGDDAVQLFLSPDENPANKQLIASHLGWTNQLEWEKYSTQSSRPIPLIAGKKYYIEVLHKEGGGLDHASIAWATPTSARSLIPLDATLPFVPSDSAGIPGLLREVYEGIPGHQLASLLNSPSFLAAPSRSEVIPTGKAPTNVADNYGTRLRGYLTPTISGEYTFWESGDDQVQLFLSTTENSADKQLIAAHTGWASPEQWQIFPTQKSLPIRLVAGKSYYIEAIHKEGVGGDNLALAWTTPGGAREILPSSVLRA